MEEYLRKKCGEMYEYAVEVRRHIHRFPETGMECRNTTDYICAQLDQYGIPYRRTGESGAIAEIAGTLDSSDAVIMIRSDMDALNVEERTGFPFASEIPGKMHACGHDLHTAMMLGAARILKEISGRFAGTVRLLFQPGEEISKGAVHLIRHGALDNVSYGFGIHMDPLQPLNVVRCSRGPDWAAVDKFIIRIHGRGTHGATPHKGNDAVVAASAVVMALQTMVSRRCDPMKQLVVTAGRIDGGTAYNIVAEDACIEGTTRSFDPELNEAIPAMLEEIAIPAAAAFGCSAEVIVDRHSKPLINDPGAYAILEKAAKKVLEPEQWQSKEPEMIGEDFSEFAALVPCVFAHLGADAGYPLHSGHIHFREESMITGMALEVQFALEALSEINAKK